MSNTIWLQPPDGGAPIEVEDDGRGVNLTPLLVAGYKQCEPPAEKKSKSKVTEEVKDNAHAS